MADDKETEGEAEKLINLVDPGEVPENVAKELREVTENSLQKLTILKLTDCCMELVIIAQDLQSRCGMCVGQDKNCPACSLAAGKLLGVLRTLAGLARFAQAATVPGSRIAAQREAEEEREADAKPGDK